MTYRKFDTGTWGDKKFERLNPMERYLFLYLWSNEQCNQSGVYEITLRRIEFETKLPIKGGSTPLEPMLKDLAEKHKMIYWWPDDEVILVRKFLKRQCQNKQFAESALKIVAEDYKKYLKLFVKSNKELFIKYGIDTSDIDTEEGSRGVEPPLNPGSTLTASVSVTDTVSDTRLNLNPSPPIVPPSPKKTKPGGDGKKPNIPYEQIVTDLNAQAGTDYKHTSRKTQELIRARYNEGFVAKDFFTVHRKKAAEWKNNPKFCKYLRPETLYGPKFEGYCNQRDPPPRLLSEAGMETAKMLENMELD